MSHSITSCLSTSKASSGSTSGSWEWSGLGCSSRPHQRLPARPQDHTDSAQNVQNMMVERTCRGLLPKKSYTSTLQSDHCSNRDKPTCDSPLPSYRHVGRRFECATYAYWTLGLRTSTSTVCRNRRRGPSLGFTHWIRHCLEKL